MVQCLRCSSYSHSVVPGGLDVKSYKTLEMPSIEQISRTIFSTTCKCTRRKMKMMVGSKRKRSMAYRSRQIRRAGDDWQSGHEVVCRKWPQNDRTGTRRDAVGRVSVEMNRNQHNGHLRNLANASTLGDYLQDKAVMLLAIPTDRAREVDENSLCWRRDRLV